MSFHKDIEVLRAEGGKRFLLLVQILHMVNYLLSNVDFTITEFYYET